MSLILTQEDNAQMMARYPDGYFDLAIVDPPYGLGIDGQKKSMNKNPKHNRKEHSKKCWDSAIPNENFFIELTRVSKNQIIWGGNYFTEYLKPTKAWVFWYKGQNGLTMSDGEMAWTSFNTVTRQIEINRANLIKQNTFHPTEKPVELYKWLLQNYSKPGDKIIDTHFGSGSHGLAYYELGLHTRGGLLVACELDAEYYNKSLHRIKMYTDAEYKATEIQKQTGQTNLFI